VPAAAMAKLIWHHPIAGNKLMDPEKDILQINAE
jgi:hypothetical protein